VPSLPARRQPLDRPHACAMPTLHPASDPPARVGGHTAGAAGDARGAGLLEGLHRQRVTTGGDRCRPLGTAEGTRGPMTPLAVSPHRDARAGLGVGTDVGVRRGGGKGGRGKRPATVGQPLTTRYGCWYCERVPWRDRRPSATRRLCARAVGAWTTGRRSGRYYPSDSRGTVVPAHAVQARALPCPSLLVTCYHARLSEKALPWPAAWHGLCRTRSHIPTDSYETKTPLYQSGRKKAP
jgi:hypothetical protein